MGRWSVFKKKSGRAQPDTESMKIGVAFPGRREVLDVRASDKISAIKAQILDKVGIPLEQQVMTYNSKTLKDHRTLKQYKIESERTIMLKGNFSEYVKVNPSDPTLQRLEERIRSNTLKSKIATEMAVKGINTSVNGVIAVEEEEEELFDIPVRVTVRYQNKELEDVIIGKQKPIRELGALIQKLLKLSSLDTVLLVREGTPANSRDTLLKNPNALIETLNLKDEDVLELRPTTVTFKVSFPNGEVISMEFDKDEDISKVVDKLLEQEREDQDSLMLMKDGMQIELEGTLDELGIVTGSYLDLKRVQDQGLTVKFTVVWENEEEGEKELKLELDPEEELWDVFKLIEEAGGGNAQRMILIDEEENELDDEGNLKDWGVSNGAVLRVQCS